MFEYSVPHEESRKIPEFAKMPDVTPNHCNTLVYAKWPPKTALVQERVALVTVLTSRGRRASVKVKMNVLALQSSSFGA